MKQKKIKSYELNSLINKREFKKIIKLIKNSDFNNDHYLLGHLAGANYELKNYNVAYKYIRKALKIESECPFLWWHLASILLAIGKNEDAITVWRHIISFEKKTKCVKENLCWESNENKNGMVIDSYYRIGITYFALGKRKKSKKYLKRFIKLKRKFKKSKVISIYSINDANKFLLKLNN